MSYRGMLAQERAELTELLRGLTDEEWETPSLCAGWRVRDVVGHLLTDTLSPLDYAAAAMRNRGSVDRINNALAASFAHLPTAQLVHMFEHDAGRLSRFSPRLMLSDLLVHQQDIRRPLNRPRAIPADRLTAVLSYPDPFAFPGRRTRGLRFIATDVDWAWGDGPEVRGPGEAIALAVVGRTVVLDELTGGGVPELRRRSS
ncbi:maleylpyruvate isomerase family mycothiol-dependent enzyme [Nocardia neocaledoniensis]|uniref:maleylpyruvate isomerase family mycothiol-dependent enzyme n=1 Tax=Nocardia neocaledoniensis TaxID=236511 RepID=UPI0024585024|nr:maleylpyruvate isomerase family mycothiol-dependent enzyme [Nocardia neocaledoniensis]